MPGESGHVTRVGGRMGLRPHLETLRRQKFLKLQGIQGRQMDKQYKMRTIKINHILV